MLLCYSSYFLYLFFTYIFHSLLEKYQMKLFYLLSLLKFTLLSSNFLFNSSHVQAATPSNIALTEYFTFAYVPYQISFNGANIIIGIKVGSITEIIEYCDGLASNNFLSGKRLLGINQLRGQNCGEGNLLLKDVNNRIQILHKQNNSIIYSPSTVLIGSQLLNDSKVFYIDAIQNKVLYDTGISTTTTISNCTSGEVTRVLQSIHADKIYLQTIFNSETDKVIEVFSSDFVALYRANISDECFSNCKDEYYISQNHSLIHAHNHTIDVYDDNGQLLFRIQRQDPVFSAYFFEGSAIYSIENQTYTDTVMLRIIGRYSGSVLSECSLEGVGTLFRIEYNTGIQKIVLYNLQNDTIYTISEVTEEQPTNNQTSTQKRSFLTEFSEALLSDQSISAISSTEIGISISLSSQLLTGVVRPIFSLIEDFWFYKYHSKIYPEFVQNLTNQFDLINYLRIQTFFADANLPQIYIGEQQSYFYSEVTCFNGSRAPLDQYFISATKQVYIYNSATAFILLLGQFLFRGIIYGFYWLNPNFLKLYILVSSRVKIRNFFTAFFLSNIGIILFFSSIQLRNMYSFQFSNKINLLLMILFHSTWLLFTFLSYILIYRYQKQSSSEDIIQISKYGLKGFFLETLIFHSRRLFLASVHGLLLDFQLIQLPILCLIDIGLIFACFKYRKKFLSYPLCISIILYFATFCSFNATLFMYSMNVLPDADYNSITTIIVIILLILTGIKTFVVIIHELINLIKWIREECCPTNRVEDGIQKKEKKTNNVKTKKKKLPKSAGKDKDSNQKQNLKKTQKKRKKTPSNPLPKTSTKQMENKERSKIKKEEKTLIEEYEESVIDGMEDKIYVNVYEWEKKIKMQFTKVKHVHKNSN